MLDCGMHMGYNDERRFPDFSYIADGNLSDTLDCVIISHFHLDHCGALPFMTEMIGYSGPVYMTVPTKAIAPILLEDMRKVAVERKGETNFFTSAHIKDCMKKVIAVTLHQTVQVIIFSPFFLNFSINSILFSRLIQKSKSKHTMPVMSWGRPCFTLKLEINPLFTR